MESPSVRAEDLHAACRRILERFSTRFAAIVGSGRRQSSVRADTLRRRRSLAANLRKHGVSFEEAVTAFDDDLAAYYPDRLHEERFISIGYSKKRRRLYIVHAEVKVSTIRIISARKATRREKAHHEND